MGQHTSNHSGKNNGNQTPVFSFPTFIGLNIFIDFSFSWSLGVNFFFVQHFPASSTLLWKFPQNLRRINYCLPHLKFIKVSLLTFSAIEFKGRSLFFYATILDTVAMSRIWNQKEKIDGQVFLGIKSAISYHSSFFLHPDYGVNFYRVIWSNCLGAVV